MKWIKASELPLKDKALPDVVVTQMENGKVFAYDTKHNLAGLKEVLKHHPDCLCFCISKSNESIPPSLSLEQEAEAIANRMIGDDPQGEEENGRWHLVQCAAVAGWNAREAQGSATISKTETVAPEKVIAEGKDPEAITIGMGLVRTGWQMACDKMFEWCNERKVSEDFAKQLFDMMDEEKKQQFSWEKFDEECKKIGKENPFQQTGVLLTRELFDKIWKAAEQKAIATQEHAQGFITWGEWDKIPDDDTIFNSLNH